jgi:hypothetical protein
MYFSFKLFKLDRLKTINKLANGLELLLIRNNNKINILYSLNKRFNSTAIQLLSKRYSSSSLPSSDQSVANILNKKLAENKSVNILIYSVKPTGSLILNSVGIFVCLLLAGVAYNTFLLFDSDRFKSRKIEDDGSFMNHIMSLMASERFKYSMCSIIFALGKLFLIFYPRQF